MSLPRTDSSPPRRSLILGCGYLGMRLAALLAEAGHDVTATTRGVERRGLVEATGARFERWDSTDPDAARSLERLAQDREWVVCAVAPSRGMNYRDVYLRTAEHLVSVMETLSPRAVVWVSSSAVYGDGEEKGWTDEDTPPRPTTDDARTLLQAEQVLLDGVARGVPVRIVRAAGIYGPERVPAHRLREGEAFVGTGREWVNLIHVEDLARILVRVAERGRDGEVVLAADGHPVRRADYYREAARLGSLPEPRFSGRPAGSGAEGPGKRLRSRRLSAELGLDLLYPDYRAGLAASVPAGSRLSADG